MLLRSVLPILGVTTFQAALMSNPGLAATRTAAISVSATVVASCQVSPIPLAAESPGSESKQRNTSVSMNCSLPVPYQVSITNSTRTDIAAHGSTNSEPTAPFPYARTYSRGLFQLWHFPGDSIEESDHGLYTLLSTGLLPDLIGADHRTVEDNYSETMTVTVTY